MKLEVDQQRLVREIEELAEISDAEPPAATRVVFSEKDLQARAWFVARCEDAGLTVRKDAVGNFFARWSGSQCGAAVVGTGSHIDAIPNAGKYDGVVGVLGGLEAIRALQRSGFQPKHPIELLLFTAEEPTRFGIGCLGSRLLSGALDAEAALRLRDKNGATLDEVRSKAGFSGQLESVKLPRDYYKAFVELHIEQGPLLEQQQIPLGIVTSIAAPASYTFLVEGAGGHAGAVLMPDRRDALSAAAELILAMEHAARNSGAVDTVATVGIVEIFPGAVNSIPSQAKFTLDLRDTDLERRERVLDMIEEARKRVATDRGVGIARELVNADAPAQCAQEVVAALAAACAKHRFAAMKMVSRAYHDSLFMSRIAPAAMLFIPCRNGWSHRPDEYAAPEDMARGVLVLAETLAALAA
jgi:ureidoglycolate amidohydrolase